METTDLSSDEVDVHGLEVAELDYEFEAVHYELWLEREAIRRERTERAVHDVRAFAAWVRARQLCPDALDALDRALGQLERTLH